jgi:hypothetical protein
VDFIAHAPARVHNKTQTDWLVLTGVEIGDVLADAVLIQDEVLAPETWNVATIEISDGDRDELGRSSCFGLRSWRRNRRLLARWLNRALLRLNRNLKHLFSRRNGTLRCWSEGALLWCRSGALPAVLLGGSLLGKSPRSAEEPEE